MVSLCETDEVFEYFQSSQSLNFLNIKVNISLLLKVALEIKLYWHMWAILTEFSQEGTYLRII